MPTAKMTSEQKRDELRLLAKQRQADRRDGYLCLSDIHSGYYDTDEHVSPWSTSAQDVDAELMIFGKDWVSSDAGGRAGPGAQAARTRLERADQQEPSQVLARPHGRARVLADVRHERLSVQKIGKKNAAIRATDMRFAAEKYALPASRIVQRSR